MISHELSLQHMAWSNHAVLKFFGSQGDDVFGLHAAEHKGQIAAIMKQHGQHFDLDFLDVWNYYGTLKNK